MAIGQREPRIDGYEKVTGRARFAADVRVPGMLHAAGLLSKHAHARIRSLDTAAARAMPGVAAVLAAGDVPGARAVGPVRQDHQVLAGDRVRFFGDVLAVAAAEHAWQAAAALEAVAVVVEPLPAVFDPDEALRPGAPRLFDDLEDNVACRHDVVRGDVDAAFREADVVLERTYRTQRVEHACIEPEAAVAIPGERAGSVRVIGSVQNPHGCRRVVARVLGVPVGLVEVVQAHLGGSFGGKDDIMAVLAARASMLARATGRPVRYALTREQSVLEGYKRHPYRMNYRVAARSDGTLLGMVIDVVADAGAITSMTPFVTWRSAVEATGPYEVGAVRTRVRGVFTNNPYTGAMRGFGSPQVIFAVESLLDELAGELGIDPLSLRRKNLLRQGSMTATGQRLDGHVVSLAQVMDAAVERSGYGKKRSAAPQGQGAVRRGVGLALSYRGCSLGAEGTDAARAHVAVEDDGSVSVITGLAENGQGLKTVMAQIAASALGCAVSRVRYLEQSTDLAPDSGPTVASRSTLMGGEAVRRAASAVCDAMLEAVAEAWGVAASELVLDGDRLRHGVGGRELEFGQAAALAVARGANLARVGSYHGPRVTWDEHTGQGDAYFTWVYGCQVADVEVDTETGRVRVVGMTAAHDVGRAINPTLAEGQVTGGVAMGIGYGLFEDVETRDGRIVTTNFDEILLATSLDVPPVEVVLVQNPDAAGPFGAKSLGEPPAELPAAALANAVAHATGRRIRSLPMDLERVLLGRSLRGQREGRESQREEPEVCTLPGGAGR